MLEDEIRNERLFNRRSADERYTVASHARGMPVRSSKSLLYLVHI